MRTRTVPAALGAALIIVGVLTGCAAGVPQAAPASPPASTAASPTPVPSPSPTAPTVRVAATCDQLVPASLVDQIAGKHLAPTSYPPRPYPSDRADARVGVLTCAWADGDPTSAHASILSLRVVPNASREGFEAFRTGEGVGGMDTASSIGPDAYTYCVDYDSATCGMHALLPDYGFVGVMWGFTTTTAAKQAAAQKLLAQVYPIVAALAAPAPLWQPPSPSLKGATGCDELATAAQLTAIVGLEAPREVKTDGGEYSTSTFDADRQVGGYWCDWVAGAGSNSVSISVLPGGASYLDELRGRDAAQSGVGQAAYWSSHGELNVSDGSGWLQVSAAGGAVTKDQLIQLAKQVLVNLGSA